MKPNFEFRVAFLAAAFLVSGCAQDGTMSTASLNTTPDPVCVTLASQIKSLEGQGVAEKVTKAETKNHKLNSSDLAKVAQFKRASADYQAKCQNIPPKPNVAAAPSNADKKAAAAAKRKLAAKGPPPIPVHKPSAATLEATKANAQAEKKPDASQASTKPATATLETTKSNAQAENKPGASQPTIAPFAATLEATKSNAQAENKPVAVQPSIETGTISGGPSAQSKPETAQTAPKAAVPVSAPATQDEAEAAQLSPMPEMQIPSVLVPAQ